MITLYFDERQGRGQWRASTGTEILDPGAEPLLRPSLQTHNVGFFQSLEKGERNSCLFCSEEKGESGEVLSENSVTVETYSSYQTRKC